MAGQISEEACERTQLQVTVGTQVGQQHWQNALLLQSHAAQHGRPLHGKEARVTFIGSNL